VPRPSSEPRWHDHRPAIPERPVPPPGSPHQTGSYQTGSHHHQTGPRPTGRAAPPGPAAWQDNRPLSGTGPVPAQWDGAPDLGLPDRRRHKTEGGTRHGQRSRRTPAWLTVLGILATVVLVGVCAAGGYIMFTDRTPADTATAAPPAQPKLHDISSRQVDPAPLTEVELFPAPAPAGYKLVKTEAADCRGAAVGEPVKLLATAGCTQMVRATLISGDKGFVVTAGLLNLDTQAAAQQANDGIHAAVGAQKGRFAGLVVPGVSDVFARVATQLGWDVRGHYLAYAVVARMDGKALDGTDPTARQIIDDLVEKYLIGTVLQARVSPPSPVPPASAPAAKASGKPSGK